MQPSSGYRRSCGQAQGYNTRGSKGTQIKDPSSTGNSPSAPAPAKSAVASPIDAVCCYSDTDRAPQFKQSFVSIGSGAIGIVMFAIRPSGPPFGEPGIVSPSFVAGGDYCCCCCGLFCCCASAGERSFCDDQGFPFGSALTLSSTLGPQFKDQISKLRCGSVAR